MQITAVSTTEHRTLVPIKGWDSVEAVLNAYNNGNIDGSCATGQNLQEKTIESHGNQAGQLVALSTALMSGQKSDFVTKMLEQAKRSMANGGKWHGSYDYDAMGTAFFKTSVDIVLLEKEEDVYGIGINAAYVGDEPEVNMAAYCNAERGIKQCVITVETGPSSDGKFAFNFETILCLLESTIYTGPTSGEEVAQAMMNGSWGTIPFFILPAHEGFQVTIKLGRVGNRFEGEFTDYWSMQGPVLFGNLAKDYSSDTETTVVKPSFHIILSKEGADAYGHDGIIWKAEEQEKITALSNEIAAAFR